MTEERVIIEPPISRIQRLDGWITLTAASCLTVLLGPLMRNLALQPAKDSLSSVFLFFWMVLIVFLVMIIIRGICQALETQTWIAGHDYFECRSRLLGLVWSRNLRAQGWDFECVGWDICDRPVLYALRPAGAAVRLSLAPFYRTTNGCDAFELGSQLALATGWPLNLPVDFERLEKELEL